MRISHREIHDYFVQYAASLTQFDARAGAQLWSLPGMLVDDRCARGGAATVVVFRVWRHTADK